MNKFEESEERGRAVFKSYLNSLGDRVSNYTENEDPYGHWDVAFEMEGRKFIVELKHRNYSNDSFSTWMLEKYKYNKLREVKFLQKRKNDTDVTLLYVNTYADGNIRVWNLDKLSSQDTIAEQEMHAKTTAVDSGKRLKEVIHLQNNKGKLV